MIKKIGAVLAAVLLLALVAGTHPAAALTRSKTAGVTYGDFSRMFTGGGGQYYSGGVVAGQWAFAPVSPVESHVYWGDPWDPAYPPLYHERFIRDGDQVLLDGWWDHGTYYQVRTTVDWQAEGDTCAGTRTTFTPGGAQHYARWLPGSGAYCAFTEGTVEELSSGATLHFRHEQIWSPPALCPANQYQPPGRVCVRQRERWSDDRGSPLTSRLLRDNWLAQGLGMAFRVQSYAPTASPSAPGPVIWLAEGRYYW